jgi:acyl carrier protein
MEYPPLNTSLARLVIKVIGEVAPHIPVATEDTRLLGDGAVLDSVGFITLLVAIEQRLEGRVDLSTAFLESGAAPDDANPFRTVASLARHLEAASGRRES